MQSEAEKRDESKDPSHGEVDASVQAVGEDLYCPHCGYNLRGLTGGRCPECGNACDLATMSRSNIPWLHRARLGGVRGWWQTCWMALRRPRRMAASINAACPYAEARRFWLINVGVMCLPMVVALVWFPITFMSDSLPLGVLWPAAKTAQDALLANLVLPWAAAMIYRPVAVVACIIGVMFATGGVSYVFQVMPIPRRQQGRAAAMGLYASGALMAGLIVSLALSAIALLMWAGSIFLAFRGWPRTDLLFMVAATFVDVPVLTVVIWWLAALLIYRKLCHAGLAGLVLVGLLLALLNLVSIVIAWGVIPWCIGLVRIIWLSFQA